MEAVVLLAKVEDLYHLYFSRTIALAFPLLFYYMFISQKRSQGKYPEFDYPSLVIKRFSFREHATSKYLGMWKRQILLSVIEGGLAW